MSLLLTSEEITKRAIEVLKGGLFVPRYEAKACVPVDKCRSCGSHEYARLSGTIICSYCRVPKEGFTVRENLRSDDAGEMAVRWFDGMFGGGVIRPDVAVRIGKDSEK